MRVNGDIGKARILQMRREGKQEVQLNSTCNGKNLKIEFCYMTCNIYISHQKSFLLIIFCLGDYFVKFPDLSPVTAFMFVQNQKRSWSVSTGIGPNWPMKTWLSECSTRVKGVWRLPSTSRGTGSSRQRWSTSNLQGRGRWLNHRYTFAFLWMTFF